MDILMKRSMHRLFSVLSVVVSVILTPAFANGIMIKDLTRVQGVRDNSLYGYGLVTGLAGTGDSVRNQASVQSLSNALTKFNIVIPANEIRSRNVAAVMVTATLPPFAQEGDTLDINVTSMGDARSLVGGTLLLTDLRGPDQRVYALAQGPLSVGGYSYDVNGNLVQKNHPTAAIVTGGAVVEVGTNTQMMTENRVQLILSSPEISTAFAISDRINEFLDMPASTPLSPAVIAIDVSSLGQDWMRQIMLIQNLEVVPSHRARVVINERTGTIVSGGGVFVAPITLSHGDIRITIQERPVAFSTQDLIAIDPKLVLDRETQLSISEEAGVNLTLPQGASIAELLTALNSANATNREIITILQTIRSAGALHGELIIQ